MFLVNETIRNNFHKINFVTGLTVQAPSRPWQASPGIMIPPSPGWIWGRWKKWSLTPKRWTIHPSKMDIKNDRGGPFGNQQYLVGAPRYPFRNKFDKVSWPVGAWHLRNQKLVLAQGSNQQAKIVKFQGSKARNRTSPSWIFADVRLTSWRNDDQTTGQARLPKIIVIPSEKTSKNNRFPKKVEECESHAALQTFKRRILVHILWSILIVAAPASNALIIKRLTIAHLDMSSANLYSNISGAKFQPWKKVSYYKITNHHYYHMMQYMLAI